MLFNPYIWGDGGGEPTENEVFTNGDRFSSLTVTNDALTGGEIYEPQSE